jgi:hypothetical protein
LETYEPFAVEVPSDMKFRVHLKDEYSNIIDFISLLSKQRQKQHELLCFQEADGSVAESFITFARYGNNRNVPLIMQANNPFITLKHERLNVEFSSVLINFAVHTGSFSPPLYVALP